MKVALIGASGRVGSRLMAELTARGHVVTAIARRPEEIEARAGVTAVAGDVSDQAALAGLLAGHDAVISAVPFRTSDPEILIAAVRASGVRRYVVVGGAASLEVAPGRRLIDNPNFPEAFREEATKGVAFLERLRQATDLDWTYLSPAANFGPGERTGRFRLGTDQLLVGPDGSRISFEDFAVALVDELEHPAHVRARFTVGY